MAGLYLRTLPLDELRRRAREAEGLLRVACQLARDDLGDPATSERARERISSIAHEVQTLLFGNDEPAPPPEDTVAPSMRGGRADDHEGHHDDEGDHGDEGDNDGEDDDDGEDEEDEFDIDYAKLEAALGNEQLMAKVPETDREWFHRVGSYLVEANERRQISERIFAAFEELHGIARGGLDDTLQALGR